MSDNKWQHIICERCWEEKEPDREPVKVKNTMAEPCCYCGNITASGIFTHEDYDKTPCRGNTGLHEHHRPEDHKKSNVWSFGYTDEMKAKVDNLVAFASKKENWYSGECKWVPGNIPDYVVYWDRWRCVFTWTQTERGVYRHLTISTPERDKGGLPNPTVVWTLGSIFGFTGGKMAGHEKIPLTKDRGDDWIPQLNREEGWVGILQKIDPKEIPI